MHIDNMLNDICKFAATHAAGALSKVVQLPLVVDEHITGFSFPPDSIISPLLHETAVSFYTPIREGVPGSSIIFYDQNTAHYLCDSMRKRQSQGAKLPGNLEVSVLSVVANILTRNFLTSMASALQIDLLMHHLSIYDVGKLGHIFSRIKDINNDLKENNLYFLAKLRQKEALIHIAFIFKYNELENVLFKSNRRIVG